MKMTEERKNELVKNYLDTEDYNGVLKLELQEILYIYFVISNKVKEDGEKDQNLLNKRNNILNAILIKIPQLDKLYVAYSITTDKPFIDNDSQVWIFSDEELAHEAAKHYIDQLITLNIKTVDHDDFLEEFSELSLLGIPKLLVDNGGFNTVIMMDNLVVKDKDENIKRNPDLKFSSVFFFQELYRTGTMKMTEEHNKIMIGLENKMMLALADSQLLVPVKMKDMHVADNEAVELESANNAQIPTLKPQDEDTLWMPAFTDWNEMLKMYSKDEWNAVVMGYEDLKAAFAGCDGVIINPGSGKVSVKLQKAQADRVDALIKARGNKRLV